MAISTKIFYIDKGVERAHKLEELLLQLRREAIVDFSVFPASNGKTQVIITYESSTFHLEKSSPEDGAREVGVSAPVFLIFDEDLRDSAVDALPHIQAYRNGTLVSLVETDLSVEANRLTISNLIDATSDAFYQIVVKGDLAAASGRTLDQDDAISFRT